MRLVDFFQNRSVAASHFLATRLELNGILPDKMSIRTESARFNPKSIIMYTVLGPNFEPGWNQQLPQGPATEGEP